MRRRFVNVLFFEFPDPVAPFPHSFIRTLAVHDENFIITFQRPLRKFRAAQ